MTSRPPFSRRPGFDYLTPEETAAVHQAALDILEKTGVLIDSPQAADLLRQAGAGINRRGDGWLARLPSELVGKCLALVPKNPVWPGRSPERDYIFQPDRTAFMCFAVHVNLIDPRTRKITVAGRQQAEDCYRVLDFLPLLPVAIDAVTIGEAPPAAMSPHNLLALLRSTDKHLNISPETPAVYRTLLKMARTAAGGEAEFRRRPFMSTTVCPTSPLRLTEDCCELIMAAARGGSPVQCVNMSLNGATAPITNAGAAAQTWAELLSGLVLSQTAAPGAPVTLSTCSTIMDMKTGLAAVGTPEAGMISSAVSALLRRFGLYGYVGGGAGDSKLPDAQAAYEFSLNALTAALAGAPLIFGAGSLEGGLTFDLAKLLLDHEAIGHIYRIINGMNTNREELALELIHEVGPGGQFMTQRHTFKRARSLSGGDLFDRRARAAWDQDGSPPAHERAYARALEIIEGHHPDHLSRDMENRLQDLMAAGDAT